jgi:hypothetical protein
MRGRGTCESSSLVCGAPPWTLLWPLFLRPRDTGCTRVRVPAIQQESNKVRMVRSEWWSHVYKIVATHLKQMITLRFPGLILQVRSHAEPAHLAAPDLFLGRLTLNITHSDNLVRRHRERVARDERVSWDRRLASERGVNQQLRFAEHLVVELPISVSQSRVVVIVFNEPTTMQLRRCFDVRLKGHRDSVAKRPLSLVSSRMLSALLRAGQIRHLP